MGILKVSELVEVIEQLKPDEIHTTIVLSTLVETCERTTITVDRIANISPINRICLSYELDLVKDDTGKLFCSEVDENTENTSIQLDFEGIEFVFGGELHAPSEISCNHEFKSLVLETRLNSLSENVVNNLLRQVPVGHSKYTA